MEFHVFFGTYCTGPQCFVCKKFGHRAAECIWKGKRKCFNCNKIGQEAKDCWFPPHSSVSNRPVHKTGVAMEMSQEQGPAEREQSEISAECLMQGGSPNQEVTDEGLRRYNDRGCVVWDTGKRVPFVSSACLGRAGAKKDISVVSGQIGEQAVTTLRDTGYSGVIVKQQFVKANEYTGRFGFMQMADNSVRKVTVANIVNDTPYCTRWVVSGALCPPDAIYDLIIGNVSGARAANDPNGAVAGNTGRV